MIATSRDVAAIVQELGLAPTSFRVGRAMEELADGLRVRRAGWHGFLVVTADAAGKRSLCHRYVDGTIERAFFSEEDLNAHDWETAE